jgi:hypothetical protein
MFVQDCHPQSCILRRRYMGFMQELKMIPSGAEVLQRASKFSLRTTTKLVYMYEDLNNVSIYDFDIKYSLDKVFTVNDWRKLKETCLASRRAKLWITLKPLKSRKESCELLQELLDHGLVKVANIIARMKISGENTNAGFFIKPGVLKNKAPEEISLTTLHQDWTGCRLFWFENKEENMEAINNLLAQLNELHDRKWKKVRKSF